MGQTYRRWAVLSICLASLGLANFVCGGPLSRKVQKASSPDRSGKSTKIVQAVGETVDQGEKTTAPQAPESPVVPEMPSAVALAVGGQESSPESSPMESPEDIDPGDEIMPVAATGDPEVEDPEEEISAASLDVESPVQPAGLSTGAIISARGPQTALGIPITTPEPAYTTYLGSQTPSLSIDWVTPESIVVGHEGIYDLVLRNPGRVPVEQIIIEQALPKGFRLVDARPQPKQIGAEPVWQIDRLDPQQEARISLRLIPLQPGDSQSQARVTFSTFSTANFRVVEPILEIDVEAPESVIIGTQAIFTVAVRNSGTGPANNAILQVRLPQGLSHVAEGSTYELGILSPSESRSIQILAEVTGQGAHVCEFVAMADGGLRDEVVKHVHALGAQLTLEVDGPDFRYVTRPAAYTVRILNEGTAPAQNVRLRTRVPVSYAFLRADSGGRFDAASNTINWFLGQIEAGEEIEVGCQLRAMDKGDFPIQAQVLAERGLRAESQHMTHVEGIAAILLEVVDVDDPVEVGTETFYEILITNQGTNFATNVQVVGEAPEGMMILAGKGPTQAHVEGRKIRFAPLHQLAPRADAIYRVIVRGMRSGDFRMRVEAIADTLDEPVLELESTKVYQD